MPLPFVTIAALGHEKPDRSAASAITYEAPGPQIVAPYHLLLLLVGRGVRAAALDNLVNMFVLPELKDDVDAVIVRAHPSSYDAAKQYITERNAVLGRFPRQPFAMLGTSRDVNGAFVDWIRGDVQEMLPGAAGLVDDQTVLRLARDAEFRMFCGRPAAILPQTEDFHYEAPNHDHYRAYFRGGFALSLKDHIDGLAFWVWAKVCPSALILVDNPGLLAAGLGIADYARRELGFDGNELPLVESRDFYGERAETLATRLEALTAGAQRRVVVLSSIVSSGASLSAIRGACEQAGFGQVDDLILFASTDGADAADAIHQLEIGLTRTFPAELGCSSCLVDRLPVVPILPETNLVEVSALLREAKITYENTQQARDFFARYREVPRAVSVHRNQHDSRRHHVIDIRVEDLCETSAFSERLHTVLDGYRGQTTAVIHPRHSAAARLAREVRNILGAAVIPAEPVELATLESADRAAIRGADVLLIVDDVAITGSRLRQYRAQLNATNLIDRRGSPLVGLVIGVLRPASAARRQGILDMVDRTDDGSRVFATVEELILPDWQTRECPWCHELGILDQLDLPEGSLIAERRELLRSGVEEGLTDGLFLPWSSTSSYRAAAEELLAPMGSDEEGMLASARRAADVERAMLDLDLGPRSILGDLRNEAQVFVAIASSIQTLRTRERIDSKDACLSETYTSPIARVLAPESYLSARFYAPVILGSVLRAARRHDLRATAIESRLRQQVAERLTDSQAVRAEIMFSMAQGLLPQPSELADPEILAGCDPTVEDFLRKLGVLQT